jgi:O-antigen chain-terminating methyltransferase
VIWLDFNKIKHFGLKMLGSVGAEEDRIFELPCQPFGAGDTERCIEIPWAISCYGGEERVLDVGYANAENRYLKELLSLSVPELYGLDVVSKDVDGIIPIKGDIRRTSFPDNFFDLILCISTIEHIGKDNSIYFEDYNNADARGDYNAIKEMRRITKKGGRIVLTVPYGKLHDYGWFTHYDDRRWNDLIRFSGCRRLREDFFIYDDGWYKTDKASLKTVLYNDNDAPAAAGLVCAILKK